MASPFTPTRLPGTPRLMMVHGNGTGFGRRLRKPPYPGPVDEIERWSPFKVWLYSLFSRGYRRHTVIVDALAPQPGDRLLDVGCGLGQILHLGASRGAVVYGIDSSPAMVERARRKVPQATLEIGPAEAIPFPDDSFDLVTAVATFHHWADRERGLGEAVRVLAPGGRLFIVEKDLAEGGDHGLSPSDAALLAARLGELGFEDVAVAELNDRRHQMITVSGALRAG